jgi:hypothetical protein
MDRSRKREPVFPTFLDKRLAKEILNDSGHLSGFISMTLEYFPSTLPHVEGFEGFH